MSTEGNADLSNDEKSEMRKLTSRERAALFGVPPVLVFVAMTLGMASGNINSFSFLPIFLISCFFLVIMTIFSIFFAFDETDNPKRDLAARILSVAPITLLIPYGLVLVFVFGGL